MSIQLIGRHFDPNIYRKVIAETYDNPHIIIANENYTHSNAASRDQHGIYRNGAPWLLNKIEYNKKLSASTTAWWGNYPIYEGSFVAGTPVIPSPFSGQPLELYGPELWDRIKPDKPLMPLGNALYELRELPDMLLDILERYEINNLKDIASYNLGVQFGWVPLLGDIRNFYDAHMKLKKRLEDLLRNNGRPVYRRLKKDNNFSVESEVIDEDVQELAPGGLVNPLLVTQAYGAEFRRVTTLRYRHKIWAAGQFVYYLPDKGELTQFQYERKLIRRLFGLRPSPLYIYRAMPWSWLFDWFGNVGNNISNLNEQVAERLICNYCFVMRSVEAVVENAISGPIHTGQGNYTTITAVTEASRVVKERAIASPFGFRIKTEGLTPFQLTILGSLAAAGNGGRGGSYGP